jgi:hypothetical protein
MSSLTRGRAEGKGDSKESSINRLFSEVINLTSAKPF